MSEWVGERLDERVGGWVGGRVMGSKGWWVSEWAGEKVSGCMGHELINGRLGASVGECISE